VFTAAAIMSVTGALVSLLRGRQFYYDDQVPVPVAVADGPAVSLPPESASTAISPNGPVPSARTADAAPAARRDDAHAPGSGGA
jgi:hypothetical protein